MRSRYVALGTVLLALAGCGGTGPGDLPPAPSASLVTPPPSTATPITPATTPATTPAPTPTQAPSPAARSRLGIDASYHQGDIDWAQVAEAGIEFAYLKATEGTGFTDPRFAEHRTAATRTGIDVAGYHYFQLCSDGRAQAEHFLSVLGAAEPAIPPALDLELAGSCSTPPPAEDLLAQVRTFLDTVDRTTGTRTVVYLYPEFEERYGFADDLAEHPQWVRRLGDRPPRRAWQIWQYDDAGTVPGINGGVDLNRTGGNSRTPRDVPPS
ncbi:glycoside hydrolase family 25 protein [Nocardioides caeni]|uniref:glycoside hydrolase family 25 protein n=1 Tax=Nocardioides caeni TaxID=574700 RepID=UPI0031EFD46B